MDAYTKMVEAQIRAKILNHAGRLSNAEIAAILVRVAVDISVEEEGLEFDRPVRAAATGLAEHLTETLRKGVVEITHEV